MQRSTLQSILTSCLVWTTVKPYLMASAQPAVSPTGKAPSLQHDDALNVADHTWHSLSAAPPLQFFVRSTVSYGAL